MRLLAETEAMRELPLPPYAFALIALAIFAASLAVTMSFRGATNRHNPKAFHSPAGPGVDGGHGHKSVGH